MPQIILIYDPEDRITGLPSETLKKLKVVEAKVRFETLEPAAVRTFSKNLVDLMLDELAKAGINDAG